MFRHLGEFGSAPFRSMGTWSPTFPRMNGTERFVVYDKMKLSHILLITVIACGLAAGSARAGSGAAPLSSVRSEANTRLMIKRAPNFGNDTQLNLYLDGRHLASFGYGRHYEGVLPAGDYMVTMQQTPHLNDAFPFSQQRIRVVPGRTNVFTAFWTDGGARIVLLGSGTVVNPWY